MFVYLKCANLKCERHFLLYAMHNWHLQFHVKFFRLMRHTHQLKEIWILWKQVMVHWMRPFGRLHLEDEKAHHESAIWTFAGFSISSRPGWAPYAVSRNLTFRMPNLRDAFCGAYMWKMHSQIQFRVLYWISKNFTFVSNCTTKFRACNVTFRMGIITFSSSFQCTLPSLKLAVSDLRTEFTNSRAWMSNGFWHFPKKNICGLKLRIVGCYCCTLKCKFCICWRFNKVFSNLPNAAATFHFCYLWMRKRVTKSNWATMISVRSRSFHFWHFKSTIWIWLTHSCFLFDFHVFSVNAQNGIQKWQNDNVKHGKMLDKCRRVHCFGEAFW